MRPDQMPQQPTRDVYGAELLPDVPELAKKLGTPDPVFDAWRDLQDKKSWVRLDLSALRIGYELGRLIKVPPNSHSTER